MHWSRVAELFELSSDERLKALVHAANVSGQPPHQLEPFCAQGAFRNTDRFARHWHDVTRLDVAGFADAAIADNDLARAMADRKSIFFAEKRLDGALIDYQAAT